MLIRVALSKSPAVTQVGSYQRCQLSSRTPRKSRTYLTVPNKVVASQLLVVSLRKVCVAIGISKGEVVALRLSGIPLHGILGGDGVKVLRGLNNVLLDRVVSNGQGGADVALPPCLSEALSTGAGF